MIQLLSMVLLVAIPSKRRFGPDAWRLVRPGRRAGGTVNKQAAGRQCLVAQHPRGKSVSRTPRQQTIVRITCRYTGRRGGPLPIRRAGYHQPLYGFDVPAGANQFGGQPIEQCRVRRFITLCAEILGRLHQARLEKHLPAAVDSHPPRERMGWINEPAGQCQAISAASRREVA